MKTLEVNHFYKFYESGEMHVGQYIGNDNDFPCCVCGKGHKAHCFNIWHDIFGEYETWGYGSEHMPEIVEDLGENIILDR